MAIAILNSVKLTFIEDSDTISLFLQTFWGNDNETKLYPDVTTTCTNSCINISANPMNGDEAAGSAEWVKSKRLFGQSNEL